jgi:branched-chain amino acid aminotransferase
MKPKSNFEPGGPDASPAQCGYAFLEGRIVPLAEARISIMTNAFLYGSAVFEAIRGYYSESRGTTLLFRLDAHCERLLRNGRMLRFHSEYSAQDIATVAARLIEANEYTEDCYLRALLYRGSLRLDLMLAGPADLTMFAVPQGRFHSDYHALDTCISTWRRTDDNALPARGKIAGAYVNSALAFTEARENGFDDAILLNQDGHVSEGSGMNLFIVKHGAVVTPPVTENILEGITRDTVLEILGRELNITAEIRSIDRTELYEADEIFFCGTGIEITGVRSVDRRIIGDGSSYPITEAIRNLYFNIARGIHGGYEDWLTPVKAPRKEKRLETAVESCI